MDKFNMIYDPNTMTKHSLYSNYGRNLLKKMLSSYKSGGVASFHPNAPPEPVTTPAPIVPSMPSEEAKEEEVVVRPTTTTESSTPPTPPLPSGPPTLMRSGPTTLMPEEEDMGEPTLHRTLAWSPGYGPSTRFPTPTPSLPGQPLVTPSYPRPMSEAQLSQDRPRSMRPAPELSGSGYSLDPSQPRIGGLGEIVKVDTCPDNQLGGDYFIDPSQPAIAGRPEVVGYKPCNHEPPIPDVADATNEIPQEVQDGGMKHVSKFVNSVINKVTGKKDEPKVNPEGGVEAVEAVDALPVADVVANDYFDPAQNHPADPRFL